MNKPILQIGITALTISLLIFGCADSTDTGQPLKKATITWFDGSVDAAFTVANEENKPIFLYWGAVWCPPCQEIKHTVFKSRRFIAQTTSFVPVYLDGDTNEAQALGEKFGVKGYPTMIVFDSSGTELTRIPGGIDITRYNDVLELSLNDIKPTSTLVEWVTSEPDRLSRNDFKQLAYYSWGQDHTALPENYSPELFLTMSELATEEVPAARLYMQYLYELAKKHDAASDDKADVVPTEGAYQKINHILDSDTLVLACWDSLAYNAADFLPYIVAAGEQEELKAKWQARLQLLSTHASLSVAEQLAGIYPRLEFYFLDDKDRELDADLKAKVIEMTTAADHATQNSFARQSVVNQINHVLQTASLIEEAKALLTKELGRSKAPYYFMSSLAAIAEKQTDTEAAIEWKRKAYEASVGAATRFQWGSNYVRTMIRLKPEAHELIVATSISLLEEMQSTSEVFAGRNFRILRTLNKQLVDWQNERQHTLLADFDAAIFQRCEQQASGSLEATNCSTLKNPG